MEACTRGRSACRPAWISLNCLFVKKFKIELFIQQRWKAFCFPWYLRAQILRAEGRLHPIPLGCYWQFGQENSILANTVSNTSKTLCLLWHLTKPSQSQPRFSQIRMRKLRHGQMAWLSHTGSQLGLHFRFTPGALEKKKLDTLDLPQYIRISGHWHF